MKCFESICERLHPAIREAYEKVGVLPGKEGLLDVDVSFDRSSQVNKAEERQYDDLWKASHVKTCQTHISGSTAVMEVD